MSELVRSGDELLETLEALASSQRMLILATLSQGRTYVSQLARDVGMSRPLLYMHLKRLESASLVEGSLELSKEDGKAMKFYHVTPFTLTVTPERIAEAVKTLSAQQE